MSNKIYVVPFNSSIVANCSKNSRIILRILQMQDNKDSADLVKWELQMKKYMWD